VFEPPTDHHLTSPGSPFLAARGICLNACTNDKYIRDICANSHYEIKETGEILTLISTSGKLLPEFRKLGQFQVKANGYLKIHYRNKMLFVHRVVYQKFIGDLNPTLDINHIDGVRTNNHRANLEQISRSENLKHSYKLGRKLAGAALGGR
jgi:hypothetical protein